MARAPSPRRPRALAPGRRFGQRRAVCHRHRFPTGRRTRAPRRRSGSAGRSATDAGSELTAGDSWAAPVGAEVAEAIDAEVGEPVTQRDVRDPLGATDRPDSERAGRRSAARPGTGPRAGEPSDGGGPRSRSRLGRGDTDSARRWPSVLAVPRGGWWRSSRRCCWVTTCWCSPTSGDCLPLAPMTRQDPASTPAAGPPSPAPELEFDPSTAGTRDERSADVFVRTA